MSQPIYLKVKQLIEDDIKQLVPNAMIQSAVSGDKRGCQTLASEFEESGKSRGCTTIG